VSPVCRAALGLSATAAAVAVCPFDWPRYTAHHIVAAESSLLDAFPATTPEQLRGNRGGGGRNAPRGDGPQLPAFDARGAAARAVAAALRGVLSRGLHQHFSGPPEPFLPQNLHESTQCVP
jgi:hypothetical protein